MRQSLGNLFTGFQSAPDSTQFPFTFPSFTIPHLLSGLSICMWALNSETLSAPVGNGLQTSHWLSPQSSTPERQLYTIPPPPITGSQSQTQASGWTAPWPTRTQGWVSDTTWSQTPPILNTRSSQSGKHICWWGFWAGEQCLMICFRERYAYLKTYPWFLILVHCSN